MPRVPRLVVTEPNGAHREVPIGTTPFRIGRQAGNELTLRDSRISRQQAQILSVNGAMVLEDMGSRHGTFVNGEKVLRHELQPKDTVDFGMPDSYKLTFLGQGATIEELVERVEAPAPTHAGSRELYHLGVLLEVARTLGTGLSLEDVLTSVVDAAIQVTRTERGVLLLANEKGELNMIVARDAQRGTLRPDQLQVSQSVVKSVAKTRRELIVSDTGEDGGMNQQESVARLELHTIVAIPIDKLPLIETLDATISTRQGELLGVLYLDSRRPAAFSKLDRQILDALAGDAASILDNARLVERERERQRMEQEIGIARDIQQALLPKNFRDYPHLAVSGVNFPCLAVGGDYFDVFSLGDNRTAFLLADVSGKGLGAALCTNLLQGALSGMSLGTDPARVFNHVNRFLCDHAEIGRYATMFFGILDDQGHLEYINAGHPSPFLIRNGVAEDVFTEGSYPVGLVPEAEYTTVCLKLEPSDTLVLFSDGVTEAMDPADQLFGVPRLKEVLMGVAPQTPLDELQRKVLDAVENFARGASQADDLTLLLVRYRGAHAMTDTDIPPIQTSSASNAA